MTFIEQRDEQKATDLHTISKKIQTAELLTNEQSKK